MVLGARRRRAQRAATASVNCHHDDASLDEIDREWATADEARRAELLEAMRALAAKYGSRVPLLVRRPTTRVPN